MVTEERSLVCEGKTEAAPAIDGATVTGERFNPTRFWHPCSMGEEGDCCRAHVGQW